MKKRDKNIRDEFTDALNAEILSRKTYDKAKPPPQEEEIFLSEFRTEERIAEPIIADGRVYPKFEPGKKISVEPEKISVEKKSPPKKVSPTPEIKTSVKVEAESELEKRIFAEAENDFYDDKTSEADKIDRPIFRSKKLKSDVIEDGKKLEDEPLDPELYRKLSRAEISGLALSLMMLVYSYVNLDKPLFFVSVSLLTHLSRPLVGSLFGKHNRAVQNAMRSFSIVLFIGAILFIFM